MTEAVPGPQSSPIGLAGRVTTPTRGPDGPGEAEFRIRGGTETFTAWSAEPLAKEQAVICLQTLGPRTLIVAPWMDPVDSLLDLG